VGGSFVLQIERGADLGARFPLEGTATIGRQEGLDVTLHDTQVSRQHARLEILDTRVILTDLGGANGTFVNRERVNGTASLLPGDVIEVGGTLLRLMGATAPQPKTVVAAQAPPIAVPPAPEAVPPGPGPVPPIVPAVSAATNRKPLLIAGAVIVAILLCLCIATVLAWAA
jgi:S-DNA-T family DNA segregation ATPase FtsK/SpoIIIE